MPGSSLEHQETAAARDRLAELLNVSQLAASSLDLNVVLGRVVEGIVKSLGATYCRICLLDPATERLVFQAVYPIHALEWEPAVNHRLDLARAPAHRAALATRTPALLSLDAEPTPDVLAEYDAASLQPARSVLLVPMCQGDEVIGLMQVGEQRSSDPRPTTAEQTELALAMAAQITVAIQNAHLHRAQVEAEREVRALNEELEQRVRERTRELQAAVRELEAFSYSVSHDLRAPLRAMDGFSRIVLERFGGDLPDDARGYLGRIRGSAQRMNQLIDDLLGFARLSRQPLTRRTVHLDQLARDVLDELVEEHQGRLIDERIDVLPTCQADPALMKQVFVKSPSERHQIYAPCWRRPDRRWVPQHRRRHRLLRQG